METVLYELHFRWGDLPILLIPLLVGIGFWAVSCSLNRASEAGKDLTTPAQRDLSHSKGVKWFLRGIALLSGAVFLLYRAEDPLRGGGLPRRLRLRGGADGRGVPR